MDLELSNTENRTLRGMNIQNNTYLNNTNPEHISKQSAVNIRNDLENCSNGLKKIDITKYTSDEHMESIRSLEILINMHRNEVLKHTKEYSYVSDRFEDISDLCPVSTSLSNEILHVFVPITIKRRNTKNKRLGAYVRYCLEEFQKEHSVKLREMFPKPVAVFCIRHVHRFNHAVFDNDNNEDGPIVNEIFQFLGRSDNPNNMRMYANGVSIVPESVPTGVEFIICTLEKASLIIENRLMWKC